MHNCMETFTVKGINVTGIHPLDLQLLLQDKKWMKNEQFN